MQAVAAAPKEAELPDRSLRDHEPCAHRHQAVDAIAVRQPEDGRSIRITPRIGWTNPKLDRGNSYQPLGVDGGIARSVQNMRALSDLLAARKIPLTIVVYPWAQQIAQGDRNSRQVSLWRDFCEGRCKAFVDLYPVFFAATDADKNWYERLYIVGDDHFSAAGNRMMFEEMARRLF